MDLVEIDVIGAEPPQARFSWGALDRAALEAAHVETVYCEAAHALDGPFTTGNIPRQSFRKGIAQHAGRADGLRSRSTPRT